MVDSLVSISPMLFAMIIGGFVYFKIDSKYNITNKMSSKISIKQTWKASFFVFCAMVSILMIGIIGIYIIHIPDILYKIIVGIIAGVSTSISFKLSNKKVL